MIHISKCRHQESCHTWGTHEESWQCNSSNRRGPIDTHETCHTIQQLKQKWPNRYTGVVAHNIEAHYSWRVYIYSVASLLIFLSIFCCMTPDVCIYIFCCITPDVCIYILLHDSWCVYLYSVASLLMCLSIFWGMTPDVYIYIVLHHSWCVYIYCVAWLLMCASILCDTTPVYLLGLFCFCC